MNLKTDQNSPSQRGKKQEKKRFVGILTLLAKQIHMGKNLTKNLKPSSPKFFWVV